MSEFGKKLRLAREDRGVSLTALTAETKVNLRLLEALEEGNFHELPGGVFRRGILRAYLKALDLDEAEWLPEFEAGVQENARQHGLKTEADEEAWVTFASNVKKNRMRQQERTGWRWAGLLLLLAILLLAGWAVWHFELRGLLGSL
jgi:cytoskeletal protein RodZ